MHVEYEMEARDLPAECIEDCSASGDVESAVSAWADHLNFTVNRENATAWLKGFGAWDDDELTAMSDRDVGMRVLWIAAGNFADGEDLVVLEY